ncbi:MAG TPA: hypothetical protein VEZ41_14775 [Allosphingosinicella sp.]|nr:hypothetical protein [Allosphingosinicella sp.]
MIGISAVALTTAFGAGAASAQTNTNNRTNCATPGAGNTTGNDCTITQGASTNENSSDAAVISGTGNTIVVSQENGQLNASTVRITGNNNFVQHSQSGVLNNARTDINGNTNTSLIFQSGNRNSATHTLNGNNNFARTDQGFGGQNGGALNSSTITANGNRISSSVFQQGRFGGAGLPGASGNRAVILTQNSGVTTNADNTSANAQTNQIFQQENGNSATIANNGGSTARGTAGTNTALASGELRASITQQNTVFQSNGTGGFVVGAPTATNNPTTENQARISLSGLGHSASVSQNGVQNNTELNINRGDSIVGQGAGTDPGTGLTVSTPFASAGNSATVTQTGRANRNFISVGFPVGQGTRQQGLGNRLTLNQTNLDPTITGHTATVYQFGQLSTVSISQNNNNLGPAGAAQGGSIAFVSQGSFFSTLSLTQTGSNDADLNQSGGRGETEQGVPAANGTGGQSGNNTLIVTQTDTGDIGGTGGSTTGTQEPGAFDPAPTPTPGTPATVARNFASVSQAGRNNSGTINQNATRASATLFQRRGSANLVATINQGVNSGFGAFTAAVPGTPPDPVTGDPGTPGTPASGVQGTGGTAGATRVTATVNQGGLSGRVDVRQGGSDLTTTVNQNNAEFSTAGRLPGTAMGSTGGGTAGTVAPVVQISQVGTRNNAEVTQNGSNSTATVDQRNTNTSGNISNVIIGQNGGSVNGANIATARQTSTGSGTGTISTNGQTGPTGDPATRTAGTFTNEIEIRQTNTGTSSEGGANSATVEQRGAGQVGRIFQNGSLNEAGILQEMTATNSTAIITQTGRGNTFFITQDQPNSFLRVTQNGNANQTVLLGSGGNNNTGGQTSTTTAPAFTPGPQ